MALLKAQRVGIIRDVSARLIPESWNMVDMILDGFGVSTPDKFGNFDDYVLLSLRGASDEALVELARHLGVEVHQSEMVAIDPAFWRDGLFKLFISHLAIHKEWASRLQSALLNFGISAFVAHEDIEPTAEWQNEIELALMTCDGMVALLHPGFHQSKWTDQEIGFAMGRTVPVFPVRLGEDPYGFIGRFQAFNGRGAAPIELAEDLCDAFCKHRQTQGRMAEVLLGFFEVSNTFAEAKERAGLLDKLQTWKRSYAQRLAKAVESNYQISNSFGVPEKVRHVIKQHGGD